MKSRILSDKSPAGLTRQFDELVAAEDITVRFVGYAVDRNYNHHAFVVYGAGADAGEDVAPLAKRFINEALTTDQPKSEPMGGFTADSTTGNPTVVRGRGRGWQARKPPVPTAEQKKSDLK